MSKKKNRAQQKTNQSQNNASANQAQTQKTAQSPVTMENLSSSKTETEFQKNKENLLAQAKKELENLQEAKEKIKVEIEEEEKTLTLIKEERQPLEKELSEVRSQLAETEERRKEEEQKANEILGDAEVQASKIIEDAQKKASGKLHDLIQDFNKKQEEFSHYQKEVNDKDIALTREKEQLVYQKEILDEGRAALQQRKERYANASPEKVDLLNIDLENEKKKYDGLRAKYDEKSKKYHEAQLILDDIEADSETTIKDLLFEFKALKERKEELERIHEKYPTEESIKELEETKRQYEALEAKIELLERERTRYKEELVANQSAQKELEITRRIADATKTLNDHLLKELESHKTALESRTGDTCPALSKVDTEVEDTKFKSDIQRRQNREKLSTLQEIVTHVKNYAGSRKEEEQLYYRDDDIRAFLAGMAVSRLLILQGMSGTGKSSLPRIFSQAISGFNHLIPVESSWRDKNELLGYYNDFNKKFNANTFTFELYRSGKEACRDIPTFIVLDEMNLARIEYYFSDFLAILQEPDPKNWLVELHPGDMRTFPMDISMNEKDLMRNDNLDIFEIWTRIEKSYKGELGAITNDDEKTKLADYLKSRNLLTGAKDLIDGRKVRVFENTWFIGTANKDESTFEITDKVYDRAQVLSLDKKGIREKYTDVKEKVIDIRDLLDLFKRAAENFSDKDKIESKLEELDELLMEKFDVSFGNRIMRQTVNFAAVFVAGGGTLENALDYQISTKILRKILTSDDMEAFMGLKEFAKDYQKTKDMIAKRIKTLEK